MPAHPSECQDSVLAGSRGGLFVDLTGKANRPYDVRPQQVCVSGSNAHHPDLKSGSGQHTAEWSIRIRHAASALRTAWLSPGALNGGRDR